MLRCNAVGDGNSLIEINRVNQRAAGRQRRANGLLPLHLRQQPSHLGAHVLKGLVERSGVDPNAVDDVVFGCCDTIGSQAGDIARSCWLAADLPMHVPGVTIDRQCGSSQQSVHFGAQAVMSGTADLVVAGGVQNMSAIPISSAMVVGEQFGFETPFTGSVGWEARFGDQEISQFNGAEMMVKKWDIKREELDNLAINSHLRAIKATEEGRFKNEILPINGCLLYTSPSPRDKRQSRMPSSA